MLVSEFSYLLSGQPKLSAGFRRQGRICRQVGGRIKHLSYCQVTFNAVKGCEAMRRNVYTKDSQGVVRNMSLAHTHAHTQAAVCV